MRRGSIATASTTRSSRPFLPEPDWFRYRATTPEPNFRARRLLRERGDSFAARPPPAERGPLPRERERAHRQDVRAAADHPGDDRDADDRDPERSLEPPRTPHQ